MRVLIVNSLYPPNVIGGAEISTQKLAEELAKRGVEVFVLATGEENSVSNQNGVTIYRRRFHNIMSFWKFKHSTYAKRLVWKLVDYLNPCNAKDIDEILETVCPDIVHTNTIYGITPYIWRCVKKKSIPIVQTLRDYNLMCPKSNLMKHGTGSCDTPRVACRIFRAGYRSMSKCVSSVTAPSQYTLSIFAKEGYFPKAEKTVVYNAIDFDEESFRKAAEQRINRTTNDRGVHVIYIGSFIETKGIQVLLEAIERCPDYIIFHFAGKGRLEESIRKAAEDHKNIQLHGFLKEEELNKLLLRMDILVCPSIWAEPFGRVIIDGYKACVPAIVSDIGGMPELVKDGITGHIVAPGSSESLARAIIEESKKEMTEKRTDAIWDKLQQFSIKKQGDSFMEIYRKSGGGYTDLEIQYLRPQNLYYNAKAVQQFNCCGKRLEAA